MVDLDPFSTRNLLNLPDIDTEAESLWQGFQFEHALHNEVFKVAEPEAKSLTGLQEGLFSLALENAPLPDTGSSTASATTGSDHGGDEEEAIVNGDGFQDYNDLWTLPDIYTRQQENRLVTWDHFLSKDHIEPETAYLTESGAAVFDAILNSARRVEQRESIRYAKPDVFLASLLELGLGKNSVFFKRDEQNHFNIQVAGDAALSGFSRESVSEVVQTLAGIGAQLRSLRTFTQENGTSSRVAEVVALSSAISTCLHAIEEHVERARSSLGSILQLNELFQQPGFLLQALANIVQDATIHRNEESFLQSLWVRIASTIQKQPTLERLLQETYLRVLVSSLQALWSDIGLGIASYKDPSATMPMYKYVLPADILELVEQTKSTRSLLEEHAPAVLVLSRTKQHDYSVPHVEFTWEGIARIQSRAWGFEQRSRDSIFNPTSMHDGPQTVAVSPAASYCATEVLERNVAFSLPDFELPTCATGTSEEDRLQNLAGQVLRPDEIFPYSTDIETGQALSLSIMPLLSAQHRLLSFHVLKLLLEDHDLLNHLQLQFRFHLLGNGSFASRVSTALFDSEQTSGEGRRRTGGKTGLRLQNRGTWPPASSELRLALMGTLSESMASPEESTLNDSISFAVRELSDTELEACMDADSIHALDFLRLQYRQPNALVESVITAQSLEKYDRIFVFLLRLLRVKNVAQELLLHSLKDNRSTRSSLANRRLAIEIQQIITTLADFCQNIAIGTAWYEFEKKLHAIVAALASNDYEGTLRLVGGLNHLRSLHEGMLDDVLRALFLKRKQARLGQVLADIFGFILRYAAAVRNGTEEVALNKLGVDFRRLVKTFMAQLSEHAVLSSGRYGGGGAEQLLLRLDFCGYWSRS